MWISVLEDEAVLNNLITKYLQKEGYSVRSYLRGEDAVPVSYTHLTLPTICSV